MELNRDTVLFVYYTTWTPGNRRNALIIGNSARMPIPEGPTERSTGHAGLRRMPIDNVSCRDNFMGNILAPRQMSEVNISHAPRCHRGSQG